MKKKIITALFLFVFAISLIGCNPYAGDVYGAGETSYSVEEYRTTMQYYDDFKILQIADLHLGIETDVAHQLDILKSNISEEKPDLIILTGDNFMYASKGVVNVLVDTLNEECRKMTDLRGGRLTKFTMTFGNHDNQGDYPRYYINEVVSSYATRDGSEITENKFAAFIDFEDDNLFGLTNFYIDLVDDRTKSLDIVDVKYRLHIIDSNTYHFMGSAYKYDVIREEQLLHAINVYSNATVDKDYVGMAFFHIPLYEYQDAYNDYSALPGNAIAGQGTFLEDVLYPYTNNASYEKLRSANIVSFVCGHNHINYGDYIYNYDSENVSERAIFSFGVKSSNQLYHDKDTIGYKTITLRDVSSEDFVNMDYVKENFKNVTGGYSNYENN